MWVVYVFVGIVVVLFGVCMVSGLFAHKEL